MKKILVTAMFAATVSSSAMSNTRMRMIKEKGILVVAVNPIKPATAEFFGKQCS